MAESTSAPVDEGEGAQPIGGSTPVLDTLGFQLEEHAVAGYRRFLEQIQALERKQAPAWARYLQKTLQTQHATTLQTATERASGALSLDALLKAENYTSEKDDAEAVAGDGVAGAGLDKMSPYSRRLYSSSSSSSSGALASAASASSSSSSWRFGTSSTPSLGELISRGVPCRERRELWSHLGGVSTLRGVHGSQYYSSLVTSGEQLPNAVLHQIDLVGDA
jgi:hypothetical protein